MWNLKISRIGLKFEEVAEFVDIELCGRSLVKA